MSKFRLPNSIKAWVEATTERPPLPKWLRPENEKYATRNQRRSFEYWTCIYWAIPPFSSALVYKIMDKENI